MINSDMKESIAKQIKILDTDGNIDDQTIAQFIEYAYTGHYQVPEPEILSGSTLDEVLDGNHVMRGREFLKCGEHVGSADSDGTDSVGSSAFASISEDRMDATSFPSWDSEWSIWGSPVLEEAGLEVPDRPRPKIGHLQMSRLQDQSQTQKNIDRWTLFCDQVVIENQKPWQPRPIRTVCEDHTNVLLCHARLYIFSSQYHCEDLLQLVMQRLRLTLSTVPPPEAGAPAILALVRYTYAHTQCYETGCDRLRSLVGDFISCHMRTLIQSEEFQSLLGEPGALAHDLVSRLTERLD